jgi:hypothetical protein
MVFALDRSAAAAALACWKGDSDDEHNPITPPRASLAAFRQIRDVARARERRSSSCCCVGFHFLGKRPGRRLSALRAVACGPVAFLSRVRIWKEVY